MKRNWMTESKVTIGLASEELVSLCVKWIDGFHVGRRRPGRVRREVSLLS